MPLGTRDTPDRGVPPPVWLGIENFFHPQDLIAMGLILGALAYARRDSWIGAGVLVALAVLSQQFALLVAMPLLVVAPSRRRATYAGASVVTIVLAVLLLLVVSSGHVTRDILLGSGNTIGNGGTVVSATHIEGAALFVVSRALPVALSFVLAAWVVRRLGRAALEPVALMSLVALSLSLRLVFERNFYGYYFLALAVSLVLLDVMAGRIRESVVAWLTLVSLVYLAGPTTSFLVWDREPWGSDVQRLLVPASHPGVPGHRPANSSRRAAPESSGVGRTHRGCPTGVAVHERPTQQSPAQCVLADRALGRRHRPCRKAAARPDS